MKVNLNDQVVVRLTEHGEGMWADHWNRFNNYGGKVPEEIQKSARTTDGRVLFQIHEIMNIFGPVCFNGSNTLPFVSNEIEI